MYFCTGVFSLDPWPSLRQSLTPQPAGARELWRDAGCCGGCREGLEKLPCFPGPLNIYRLLAGHATSSLKLACSRFVEFRVPLLLPRQDQTKLFQWPGDWASRSSCKELSSVSNSDSFNDG